MSAHDGFDGFRRFVCVIKWDGGYVVVENMGLNDAVQKLAANETEFAIDGCSSATSIGPGVGLVVGKRRVSVLKVCDCHCSHC